MISFVLIILFIIDFTSSKKSSIQSNNHDKILISSLAYVSASTSSQYTANLSNVGYNYVLTLKVGSHKKATTFIVDTGNGDFTVLKSGINSSNVAIVANKTECTFLNEDNTSVMYYTTGGENAFTSCSSGETIASIGFASISTNITIAKTLKIDNPNLHPWEEANGDIGIGYCYDPYYGPCYLSSFQALLMNISGYDKSYIKMVYNGVSPFPSTLKFGLNFKPKATNVNSTMQLGFVDAKYENSLVWQKQAAQYPEYHTIFISDLTICGQNILSSMANTWGVLIDTGSVCLNLPEEIYNIFIAWIDLSPINDASTLPTFTFSIANQDFYIPLSSLLVEESMITVESGAPLIIINGIKMRICVLQGDPISSSESNTYSVGNIVFGTLVLQNIYFAADYGSKSVGFASKISGSQIAQFSTASCKAPINCVGSTTYNNYTNSCSISCNSFIFTAYNEKTKSCSYSSNVVGIGLFILFLVVWMEITSYFVMQYSAVQLLEDNGNIRRSTTFGITKIDQVTIYVGGKLTYFVDTVSDYFNSDGNFAPIHASNPQIQNILNHRV